MVTESNQFKGQVTIRPDGIVIHPHQTKVHVHVYIDHIHVHVGIGLLIGIP